jgi:beta-lactam-binding protein with PASTA domain
VAVGAFVFIFLGGRGGGQATPSASGALVSVPVVVGMPSAQARTTLETAGLVMVLFDTVQDATLDPGTIAVQEPSAGTPVALGSTVKVTVATGRATVNVPDVRGSTEAGAVTIFLQQKLVPGTRTEAFDPVVPDGQVISTSPSTGNPVAEGTPIDYVVSKGPQPTPSPSPTAAPTPSPTAAPTSSPVADLNVGDYVCLTLTDAENFIVGDGFKVGTLKPPDAGPSWIVASQNPAPGTSKKAGSRIDLTLADAPCPTPSPPP